MKSIYIRFAVVLSCSASSASWPWVGSNKAVSRSAPARRYTDPNNFNPVELLDPEMPKPEIWEKALVELQSLKTKPSCNRLAAIMLMNDCRFLEKHDDYHDRSLPSDSEYRILDHINSYAASLAICDLDAARAPIPDSCEPFRDTALLVIAKRGGAGGLHLSHDQIGLCMNGLVSDQSSWTSWNSNRDRAMIICRASRIDVEKDETLSLYEDTARVLSTLLKEFKIELENRRELLTEQDATMKSYFQVAMANFIGLNDKILFAISDVSKHFKGIIGILTTASKKAEDVEKVLDRLRVEMLKSYTERESVQEQALAATNGLALGAKIARTEVEAVLQLLADVTLNMDSMRFKISTMQRRQDSMDAQSTKALFIIKNLTEQLQLVTSLSDDHVVNMEQVKQATLSLVDLAEEATISFSSASGSLLSPNGPLGINWLLMVIVPLMTVTLGGYGLPASVLRNLALMGCGLVLAELLTIACNVQWFSKLATPSWTQFARRQPPISTVVSDLTALNLSISPIETTASETN